MHFFIHIDNNNINAQVAADAFGPDSNDPTNKFNITSRFQLTGQTKAFACQDSLMIVQQSSVDSTVVSVILKPIEGLKIPFNSVKYFVYRGLLKNFTLSNNDGAWLAFITNPHASILYLNYYLTKILQL